MNELVKEAPDQEQVPFVVTNDDNADVELVNADEADAAIAEAQAEDE